MSTAGTAPGTAARDSDAVTELVRSTQDLVTEIAGLRAGLRRTWQEQTETVERVQAQLRAVDSSLTRRTDEFTDLMRNLGHRPVRFRPYPVPEATIHGWLHQAGNGVWGLKVDLEGSFDQDFELARNHFIQSRKRPAGGGGRRASVQALGRYRARLKRLQAVRHLLDQEVRQAFDARLLAAAQERVLADGALTHSADLSRRALQQLPAPMQPWDSAIWRDWNGAEPVPGVQALFAAILVALDDQDLGPSFNFGAGVLVPLFLSLRSNLQLVYTNNIRPDALTLARSLLLRQLASALPGELHFSFYDPVGLGQSVAELIDLAEHDSTHVGGTVWSSPQDLATCLAELTSHIESVTQKYLGSTYDNLDDYNRAGASSQPYRLLVLFDLPTGLSEETLGRLNSILLNGPRCGVHTLLLHNASVTPASGVDINQIHGPIRRIKLDDDWIEEHSGYALHLRLGLDAPGMENHARRIVDRVGRGATASVPLTTIEPSVFRTELASSGTSGIRLRIGALTTTSGMADIELNREPGANVLAVLRHEQAGGVGAQPSASPPYGLLTAAVASAAQSPARIDVIDFMPVEERLDHVLEPFLNHDRITLSRREALGSLLEAASAEVQGRVDQGDTLRPARILFLFGIHRIRKLGTDISSLDADRNLFRALQRILHNGPEVGVHVWLWADSLTGASRLLSEPMRQECHWRIAGTMSVKDSLFLIGTEQANAIEDRQLILGNKLGTPPPTRAMSFSLPTRSWLEAVTEPLPTTTTRQQQD